MTKIEFVYQGVNTLIQCNPNEQMKNVIEKFITKAEIKNPNSIYFLYKGDKFNNDLKVESMIKEDDKKANKIKILVNLIDEPANTNSYQQSKYIICPKCQQNINLKINKYKISLFDCINKHTTKFILLSEFENTQKIDLSKIICDKCKSNKSETYKNEFFKCLNCKINICPLCKSLHNREHDIINYDKKDYICELHNESYIKYCSDCKTNMCFLCVNEHNGHNIISYENIIPDLKKAEIKMRELKDNIDIFKENIKNIINKLNIVVKNLDIYYNIYKKIIDNYEKKNRNYEIMNNINQIINDNIIEEIKQINNDINIENQFIKCMNIFKNLNENEISLVYEISEKSKEKGTIKIFGNNFVQNNIDICKIMHENKQYKLSENFDIKNLKKNKLEIKLKGFDNVENMSFLFEGCNSLSPLSELSKWDTKNVTNMSFLFSDCSSLKSIPDISNWNTSNVINMSGMFRECNNLESLPDISKWNTSNVKYMGGVYNKKSLLSPMIYTELYDFQGEVISGGMFEKCYISTFPDISKWDISNVRNLSGMFTGCNSLPDISKWNTQNVIDMNGMFYECRNLKSMPDISNWNINNVKMLRGIFYECSLLETLPDISNWNTKNVTDISLLFYNCHSLISLPDISKWDISNVTDMMGTFELCSNLKSLPDISKWDTSKVI